MEESAPLTFLCITTYEKGQEFMRECKRQGCRVFLLTAEKLRDADWPRESLDDVFYIPAELPIPEIVKAVTYLARDKKIDRIVALDEFDMETAATLREHMRIPGMGLTTMRYFRDKLAMRMQALEHGIRVPDFIPVLNHDDIRYYLDHVSGPWVLKPRSEASAIGIKLIDAPEALVADPRLARRPAVFVSAGKVHPWRRLSRGFSGLGARSGLLQCQPLRPATDGGGAEGRHLYHVSSSRRVGRGDALRDLNRELIDALGLVRGVSHAEFIRAGSDGHFYFLECAARVGGAYISEMVEIATGINLWREWARIEIAGGKEPYRLPAVRSDYAGLILSLARQEDPDTSAYNDPEIALRLKRRHHAGLVLRSSDPARIQSLLENYSRRFAEEFLAIEPPGTKPAA